MKQLITILVIAAAAFGVWMAWWWYRGLKRAFPGK
jgi:hypothetical protein